MSNIIPEGKQILLIDDPGGAGEVVAALRDLGLQVTCLGDPGEALTRAAREEFDMAIVAAALLGENPRETLARLRAGSLVPAVVVLARPEETRRAVATLALGADDYLLRPLDPAEARARVGRILRWQDLDAQAIDQRKELSRRYLVGNLVCRSEGMRQVRDQILQVATARSTVLILGESGVGKELVAKAIHYNSPRREAPFIAINCSAIPSGLIESELFGHERGAFTGAIERRKGKFELAHGGTIFLDEVGEMDLPTQVKLLRVLEEREFMRVGGGREVRVDVRVLAATNSDLEELVARRAFRDDLYFRLKVISIRVPPLRERSADVSELARDLLRAVCRDNGLSPRRLTGRATRALERYAWPGNVRELKNILERTVITRPGELIRWADLPQAVRGEGAPAAAPPVRAGVSLMEMEKSLIRRTLVATGGNRTHAARTLRIGVRTLQRKVKSYGIRVPFAAPRGRPAARRSGTERLTSHRSTDTPSPASSGSGST